jgi:hypothetical protein
MEKKMMKMMVKVEIYLIIQEMKSQTQKRDLWRELLILYQNYLF